MSHPPLLILPRTPSRQSAVSKSNRGARDKQCTAKNTTPSNYLLSGGMRARDREEHAKLRDATTMQDLRTANTALANELMRLKSAHERDTSRMQQQLSDALAELKHLRDQHEDACKKLTGHATAVEELHAKHKERARELKQRLREEQAARSTSLHDITTLTEQVQQLQRQLHSAHEKLNALAPCMKQRDQALGRVQELEQLLRQASSTSTTTSVKLSTVEKQRDRLQEEYTAIQEELERERMLVVEVQQEARRHQELAVAAQEQAKQAHAELKTAHETTEEYKARYAKGQSHVRELETTLRMTQQQLKEQQEATHTLEQEATHLREQDTHLRTALDTAQGEVTSLKTLVQTRTAELQDSRALLDARARQANAVEHHAAAAHQAQGEDLRAAQQEVLKLREQLQGAQRGVEGVEGLVKKAEGMQQQVVGLEKELSTKDKDIQQLQHQLVDVMHTLTTTKEHVAAAQAATAAAQQQYHEECLRHQQTQHALQQAEQRSAQGCQQVVTLQHELVALQAQVVDLQQRLTAAKHAVSEHGVQHQQAAQEHAHVVEELMTTLRAQELTNAQLGQQIKMLTSQTSELQASLQEAMRDKARVEDAYTSASASLNTLRRRTELLREENKAFMATYDNHLEKLMSPSKASVKHMSVYCTPPRVRG